MEARWYRVEVKVKMEAYQDYFDMVWNVMAKTPDEAKARAEEQVSKEFNGDLVKAIKATYDEDNHIGSPFRTPTPSSSPLPI